MCFNDSLGKYVCVWDLYWGTQHPTGRPGVGEGLGVRFCLGLVNYIGIDVCSVALSPFCPAPIVSQLLQTKCLLTSDAPPKQVSCEEV